LFFSTDASRGRPSTERANKGDALYIPGIIVLILVILLLIWLL